jgi:hypothetical protein
MLYTATAMPWVESWKVVRIGASEDTGERACCFWANVRDAIVIPENHGDIQIKPRIPGKSYIESVHGAMPWRSQRKGVAQAGGGRQDEGVGVLKRSVRSQVRKYPSNRSPGPSSGRKSTSGISTACSGLIFRDIGRITLLIYFSNGLWHSQQLKQPCLIPLLECLGGPFSPQNSRP